jgi:hypothetical protein
MHIGRYVKYPKLELSRQIFEIYSNVKFDENLSSRKWIVPSVSMDRQIEITKLTVAFCNFANVPSKGMNRSIRKNSKWPINTTRIPARLFNSRGYRIYCQEYRVNFVSLCRSLDNRWGNPSTITSQVTLRSPSTTSCQKNITDPC